MHPKELLLPVALVFCLASYTMNHAYKAGVKENTIQQDTTTRFPEIKKNRSSTIKEKKVDSGEVPIIIPYSAYNTA